MSNVFNKFVGFITGEDPEDDVYDEEMEYQEEERENDKPYKRKMRDYEEAEENRRQAKLISMASSRVAQGSAISSGSKVIITQPHQYDEVTEIADYLKSRRSVIVNLEFVNKEDARKIVDFLSGAAYGVDGNIQKISNFIFFIAPSNVEVQNESSKADLKNRMNYSWLKQ